MNDPAVQLRRRIDESLPSVPTVLLSLVYDYVYPETYRFADWKTTDGLPPKTVMADDADDGSAKLIHNDGGFGPNKPWYVFVAQTTAAFGSGRWTVDRVYDSFAFDGWLAIGITTTTASHFGIPDYQSADEIAPNNSWMIFPAVGDYIYHADDEPVAIASVRLSTPDDGGSTNDRNPKNRVEFVADPANLRIVCRLGSGPPFVFMVAASEDEFWSIRPCVALAGQVAVVVRSVRY